MQPFHALKQEDANARVPVAVPEAAQTPKSLDNGSCNPDVVAETRREAPHMT